MNKVNVTARADNRKAFELDTIMTFVQGIIFVVMVIWLVLFTSQARPDRSEKIGLQVLSEKYPDERNLLYLTDDNGYKLTDLMGRELLIGGNLTLQGDYSAIVQDTYPTVFESPFYKNGNTHVACPNPIPVEYDSGYNVSNVNISYYMHCYVIPKKLGKLFSYPLDLQKTYELADTGTRIVSAWAENNKIYYSVSCNKGYNWGQIFQIPGSDDGYFPLLANYSSNLYAIWMKVYPDNFIDVAYAQADINTLAPGCADIAWTPVSLYTRSVCYLFSPLHMLCSNPKVEEYDKTVGSYVAYCQERVPTYFPSASCTSDRRVLDGEYRYTNLPSVFKEKKNYTYYLSKVEPRYRIDLTYDDGVTKANTVYGSESLGGQVRESAPIEFAPPAGFEGAVKMRLTTQ